MTMTMPLKTRSAARAIGVSLPALRSAIASGKLDPPPKDESGDFLWSSQDLERARQGLAVDRRRKVQPAEPAAQEAVT